MSIGAELGHHIFHTQLKKNSKDSMEGLNTPNSPLRTPVECATVILCIN